MGYDTLVLGALRLLGASGDVHVALGLHLGVFTRKEERKALADSGKGVRSPIRVDDGINADIGIASASVYPQGVGALLHQYSLQRPEGATNLSA